MPTLKIGSLTLDNQLLLAPMFKVTDPAFRLLCREQGAALTFTEMTHSEAILRNPRVAAQASHTTPSDHPFGIQVSSAQPDRLIQTIQLLEEKADLFDINLGCPSDRTRESGIGSALLDHPDRVEALIHAMRKATQKPITAKIRLPSRPQDALDIAKRIENAGADGLTVHARTVLQGHSGPVDLDLVAKVKETLSIPVINNGGVWNQETYEYVLHTTHCDGVMLARSAIGNPGIFAQVQGKPGISPVDGLVRYLDHCETYGFLHVGRIKTNCLHFLSAIPKTKKADFSKAKTITELKALAAEVKANQTN